MNTYKELREMSLDDIKRFSLQGLIEFDKICSSYNLTYYLAYGTLLGAIRHKGFIPWDDDIDLWMPRSDYDRLISLKQEILSDKWELLTPETDKGYYSAWLKFCNKETIITPSRFSSGLLYGVSIDIFPLDTNKKVETLQTQEERIDYVKKLHRSYMYLPTLLHVFGYDTKPSFKSKVARLLLPSPEFFFKRYCQSIRSCNSLGSNYISCIQTPVARVFQKDNFENSTFCEFEGYTFSIPSNYDEVLRICYGDYMKLPPKEQQITHHNYVAYFK